MGKPLVLACRKCLSQDIEFWIDNYFLSSLGTYSLSSTIYCCHEKAAIRLVFIPLQVNSSFISINFGLSFSLMFCNFATMCLGMDLFLFPCLVLKCNFDLRSSSLNMSQNDLFKYCLTVPSLLFLPDSP